MNFKTGILAVVLCGLFAVGCGGGPCDDYEACCEEVGGTCDTGSLSDDQCQAGLDAAQALGFCE